MALSSQTSGSVNVSSQNKILRREERSAVGRKRCLLNGQECNRVLEQLLELLQEAAGLRAVGYAMVNRERGFHEEGDPDLAGRRKWIKPGFPILTPHKEPSGERRHLHL